MKIKLVAIVMLLVFLLSGCSALSLDSSDIMTPPKATGNKADIQELIDKQTSGDYTLKYPKNGTNRSSIVMQNLDSDEDEEAIAFYSDKNNNAIHALFVECTDGEYSVFDDVIFEASNVDRIDFADIDGDSTYEILIGYSTATSSLNVLNIYSYKDSVEKFNISCVYSSLLTGDFNSDKRDDILLISLYSGDISAMAKLMIYNNGGLSELGSTELDSDITQLAAVSYGQISYGTYGAVIDGISTSGDYTTQVVYFDPSQPALINPLYSYSGYSSTRRTTQICSTDFDKNELIDIPVCALMPYSESEDINTISREVNWSDFDTESHALNVTKEAIICPQDGYLLTMPEKWSDAVTARYNESERETTIYAYAFSGNTLNLTDKLITIKAFFDEDFDNGSSGYREFLRAGSTVYAYSIGTADSYLSITGEDLSSLFSLANQ